MMSSETLILLTQSCTLNYVMQGRVQRFCVNQIFTLLNSAGSHKHTCPWPRRWAVVGAEQSKYGWCWYLMLYWYWSVRMYCDQYFSLSPVCTAEASSKRKPVCLSAATLKCQSPEQAVCSASPKSRDSAAPDKLGCSVTMTTHRQSTQRQEVVLYDQAEDETHLYKHMKTHAWKRRATQAERGGWTPTRLQHPTGPHPEVTRL